MNKLLNVSTSPHVRSSASTSSIMCDVLIAMVPAALFGIYQFGFRAFLIIAICVASAVLTEYIYETAMKKPVTIMDYSAAVTGLILALNMPAYIDLWIPALGSIFAILIVKQLYGGLGQNFMNPALAGRCFLLISFAGKMTQFFPDGVSGATPLAAMKAGQSFPLLLEADKSVTLLNMFIGTIPGTIGETSVIALLIGAAYMLAKKVINWKIPFTYIATVAVFVLIFGGHGFDLTYVAAHICGGGLIFGAFFMATDYVTSPITPNGQIVYGVCLGLLTGIFRIFGPSAEGVSYAIIFCNLLVPLIEKVTMPVPFGREAKK